MAHDWRLNEIVIPVEQPYEIEQVKEIVKGDGTRVTETQIVTRTKKVGDAVYKYVGVCTFCGQRVFQRTSELEADAEIGDRLAIHVGEHTDDLDGKKTPQIIDAHCYIQKHENGAEYRFAGACIHCGLITFTCITKVRDDALVGDRLVTYVNSGKNIPPDVNCSHCYLRKNPTIAQVIMSGERARSKQKTEQERILDQATAALGGRGFVTRV